MNSFDKFSHLSARDTVMGVMHSKMASQHSVCQLIQAGSVFGIEPSAIRAAITRLTDEDQLERKERGVYSIGKQAENLHQRVLSWRYASLRRCDWDGGWQMVIAGPDARTDRARWRRTLDMLELEGYSDTTNNVWVRPDNLDGGVAATRQRLAGLDAVDDLLVLRADCLDEKTDSQFRELWNVGELLELHQSLCDNMQKTMQRYASIPEKELEKAARETLLLTRYAIKIILRDPLLPAVMCPAQDLETLIETTKGFDRMTKKIWQAFMNCPVVDG